MRELPILFNTEMVQAVLDGRKTETRRIINPQPIWDIEGSGNIITGDHKYCIKVDGHPNWRKQFVFEVPCRYGQVGDKLYVRETWAFREKHNKYYYKADWTEKSPYGDVKWKPSIHLSKKASRIWLEVTGVSIERVQQITQEGSRAEGVSRSAPHGHGFRGLVIETTPGNFIEDEYGESHSTGAEDCLICPFKHLWNSINAKRGFSWEKNPFVWVVKYKLIGVSTKIPSASDTHMSVNLNALLKRYKNIKIDIITHDNGRIMSDKEARVEIQERIDQGHKLMCCSDNCEDFDPFGNGCPGHPMK